MRRRIEFHGAVWRNVKRLAVVMVYEASGGEPDTRKDARVAMWEGHLFFEETGRKNDDIDCITRYADSVSMSEIRARANARDTRRGSERPRIRGLVTLPRRESN